MTLPIGGIEPVVAHTFQTWNFAREKTFDGEHLRPTRGRLHLPQLDQLLPTRAKQLANQMVVLNQLVRAEAAVAERE